MDHPAEVKITEDLNLRIERAVASVDSFLGFMDTVKNTVPTDEENNVICQALLEVAFTVEPSKEWFLPRVIEILAGYKRCGDSSYAAEEFGRSVAHGRPELDKAVLIAAGSVELDQRQWIKVPRCESDSLSVQATAFVDDLAAATGMNWHGEVSSNRQMHIAVSRANYGRPSSVVIEFCGSPARFTVFMSGIGEAPQGRCLMINGKAMRSYSAAHGKACKIIDDLLRENGVIA